MNSFDAGLIDDMDMPSAVVATNIPEGPVCRVDFGVELDDTDDLETVPFQENINCGIPSLQWACKENS